MVKKKKCEKWVGVQKVKTKKKKIVFKRPHSSIIYILVKFFEECVGVALRIKRPQ